MAEKEFNLVERVLLRYALELQETFMAGERIDQPLTFKEALDNPRVREHLAYLLVLGQDVLDPTDDDLENYLSRTFEDDLDAIQRIRQGFNSCPECEEAICPSCDVCHTCHPEAEHEQHETSPTKHSKLN
jgi:hypothetical protein